MLPRAGSASRVPHNKWGRLPAQVLQSLPNFVSEPHPNASRLCQGDWKFLLSGFSGAISTLLSGRWGGGARLLDRLCILMAPLSAQGETGRALLGLLESLRNNNKQPTPTTVTCIECLLCARSCAKSRLAWPQGTFQHPGEATTVTQPTPE